MKTIIGLAAIILSVCASGANAQQKVPKQIAKLLAMTPEEFASCATVADDSLDTVATISTEPCFTQKQGLLGIVWNDNFVRVLINKRTGIAVYQVYQMINYDGDWRFYSTANYETPTGPNSVPVKIIGRDVVGCSGRTYGRGCTLSEHIAFEVEEDLFKLIASKWEAGSQAIWRFKFGAKASEDWQDGLTAAEITGAVMAVDRYRAAHPKP